MGDARRSASRAGSWRSRNTSNTTLPATMIARKIHPAGQSRVPAGTNSSAARPANQAKGTRSVRSFVAVPCPGVLSGREDGLSQPRVQPPRGGAIGAGGVPKTGGSTQAGWAPPGEPAVEPVEARWAGRLGSAPLPHRLALLRERDRALPRVLRREDRPGDLALALPGLIQRPVLAPADDRLGRLERERAVGDQLPREPASFGQGLA